jgi:branched-subunit amino acid ABC-type transport system permease component
MKRVVLASAIAASVSVAGCATDPYGYNNNPQAQRAVQGAALGGLVGAATGAVVGGVSPVEGALVGAALGGVAGAVIKGKQYYRDTRGYCYYVDQYGNPIYDYNARC